MTTHGKPCRSQADRSKLLLGLALCSSAGLLINGFSSLNMAQLEQPVQTDQARDTTDILLSLAGQQSPMDSLGMAWLFAV